MLTEKQIQNLRKVVRHKWIPGFMLGMGVFCLFAAGMKILFVQRICSLSGLTWNHVLSLAFSRPEPAASYQGVEVLAAGGVETAILYFGCAIIFVIYFFVVRSMRKRNMLLLQYIDKERWTQPEDPCDSE